MTKKQFVRACAFVLIFALVLFFLSDVFELENTNHFDQRIYTYREYPEDTVDAVYIGTSGVDRYWIGPKAYEEYGMTVYPLSVDEMPVWLFTNMIDEALTYHDPQLFIIDARAFGQVHNASKMDTSARRVLDSMQYLSKNWFKTVRKTLDTIHSVDETKSRWDISYYLPFVKYHSKWTEEDYSIHDNVGSRINEYGGFYVGKVLSLQIEEQKEVEFDPTLREELDPLSEQSLYEVINYAKEKDIQLLFVDTPQFMDKEEMGKANTIYDILEQEGVDYISYVTGAEEEMGLDPKTDFYNAGHVNYYGAEKFTKVFAKYLDDNYDLPDRRNDPQVQENWDNVYDNILETIDKYEKDAQENKDAGIENTEDIEE